MIDPIVSATSSATTFAAGRTSSVATSAATAGPAAAREAAPGDFASVLAQVASDAVQTLKTAEATAISGVQGKADVQQVVEAVMSAEQALQGAVAIRDKVVSAYLEISRIAI